MFVAREQELFQIQEQLSDSKRKTVFLIYGRRRVGKSKLIQEAIRNFHGITINHLCVRSSYEGNLRLLGRNVARSFSYNGIQFEDLFDIFDFIARQQKPCVLVLDEYSYLKESRPKGEIDSMLQGIADSLPPYVKLILCGSYVTQMQELIHEDNPLFGRLTGVLHLKSFDYLDASLMAKHLSCRQKIEQYAVFGGVPYVLENLHPDSPISEDIIEGLINPNGLLRIFIEDVALKEIRKSFDERILECLGNGKKRYSEIEAFLCSNSSLNTDKQLKALMEMDMIEKVYPINKPNDAKKRFYSISDNLLRFYFTFIFGNEDLINRLGPAAYYEEYIKTKLLTFMSLRFESIALQYFRRLAVHGRLKGVDDFGTFWYDDAGTRTNRQFDCVLHRKEGYDFYECKLYDKPMKKKECIQEESQIRSIGIPCFKIGFVCSAGFDFQDDQYYLISEKDLYAEELLK